MKRNIIWLLPVLMLAACQGRKVIPEITPHLATQRVHAAPRDQDMVKVVQLDSQLVFIDSKHRISRFNPGDASIDSMYQSTRPIEAAVYHRDRWLVMTYEGGDLALFDLRQMKIVSEIPGDPPRAVLGVDGRVLVYRDQLLRIYDHRAGKVLHSIPIQEDILGKVHISGDRLYIPTARALTVFDRSENRHTTHALKDPAVSGFLHLDGSVYYGSESRELIRLSLSSFKPVWKFKLAMPLNFVPEMVGGKIVVTALDNNIYFFKPNGTLHWWEPLDSTQKMAAVPMGENVAVFLMNGKVKFFNPKTKETREYKLTTNPAGPPIYLDRYLYGITRAGNGKPAVVSRLGNLYQVQIKIEPESLKHVGKSMKIGLIPLNLIKPNLTVSILNQNKEEVLKKLLKGEKNLQFIWIPRQAGAFQLVVDAASENRDRIRVTKSFQVVDLSDITSRANFRVLKRCQFDKIH